MHIQQKYSNELKELVIHEYQQGIYGYTRLAKRYSLTRDLVRRWILTNQKRRISNLTLKKPKKREFKNIEDEVKYLQDAAMYWETYAKMLEEEIPISKKKAEKLEQFKNAQKKEL